MKSGFWPITIAIAVLVPCGCKSADQQIVGTWSGAKGGTYFFKSDHTYVEGNHFGTWVRDKNQVKVKIASIGGRTIDTLLLGIYKAQKLDPDDPKAIAFGKQFKATLENMVFLLSEDGKSMNPADPVKIATGTITKNSDTP